MGNLGTAPFCKSRGCNKMLASPSRKVSYRGVIGIVPRFENPAIKEVFLVYGLEATFSTHALSGGHHPPEDTTFLSGACAVIVLYLHGIYLENWLLMVKILLDDV